MPVVPCCQVVEVIRLGLIVANKFGVDVVVIEVRIIVAEGNSTVSIFFGRELVATANREIADFVVAIVVLIVVCHPNDRPLVATRVIVELIVTEADGFDRSGAHGDVVDLEHLAATKHRQSRCSGRAGNRRYPHVIFLISRQADNAAAGSSHGPHAGAADLVLIGRHLLLVALADRLNLTAGARRVDRVGCRRGGWLTHWR